MSTVRRAVELSDSHYYATGGFVNVFDSNMDDSALFCGVSIYDEKGRASGPAESIGFYITPGEARELALALLDVAAYVEMRQQKA